LGLIGVCLMHWKNVDTVGLVYLIGFDIVDSWGFVFYLCFINQLIDWLSWTLWWVGRESRMVEYG